MGVEESDTSGGGEAAPSLAIVISGWSRTPEWTGWSTEVLQMTWSAKITGATRWLRSCKPPSRPARWQAWRSSAFRATPGAELHRAPYDGQPPSGIQRNLLASIVPHVFEEQSLVRLVIGAGNVNGADLYAAPVETGARPHMPPSEALVLWVPRSSVRG